MDDSAIDARLTPQYFMANGFTESRETAGKEGIPYRCYWKAKVTIAELRGILGMDSDTFRHECVQSTIDNVFDIRVGSVRCSLTVIPPQELTDATSVTVSVWARTGVALTPRRPEFRMGERQVSQYLLENKFRYDQKDGWYIRDKVAVGELRRILGVELMEISVCPGMNANSDPDAFDVHLPDGWSCTIRPLQALDPPYYELKDTTLVKATVLRCRRKPGTTKP